MKCPYEQITKCGLELLTWSLVYQNMKVSIYEVNKHAAMSPGRTILYTLVHLHQICVKCMTKAQ